ncbi:MAG TPA: RdgB/HAM1 family non-canonical purine NTP pyrophosphatase [Gemmatimonadales bacterium]|jgi:XTP/dITP diphosphohydrolase|nr:RdgB/HAM1 family non-canonical purine NTP pyrophosphatase [Gemmatimonadales bacterium]
MKLLVATRNPGKLAEARQLLEPGGIAVVSPDEAGVTWSAAEELLEQAETFEGNACAKAEYFAKRVGGLPTVADDSGLEVIALGGAPGVRSKRWAGATGSAQDVDAANNRELLRRLLGAPDARRRARYRCVLALAQPGQLVPQLFEGLSAGTILTEPRGTGGFGYDPLFLSDELGKTFGEASPEEKNEVSHRGRAFRQLVEALGS